MQLDKQLYDEINDYCKINGLKTRDFIHELLKNAFMKEKYGDSPFFFDKNPNTQKPTTEMKEEKTSVNDNDLSPLVMKVFNETLGSKIRPVEVNELLTQEPQVETQKEENLKIKKKRVLK
jgi:HSP90 family molecular chaperone